MNTATQIFSAGVSAREIKEKIRMVLKAHALIDSENISVKARGSEVILAGKVRSWTERKDAEDAVWSLPGVKEVVNNIEVEGEVYTGE